MDGEPRLHIEYARLDGNGQIQYEWDEFDGQFRPSPFRERYHPGQKVPFSVVGGMQVEHLVAIFQAPVTGDWWISYRDELLGYYPAGLFKVLNTKACMTQWYIEIARLTPASATGWAKTEGGSGKFAKEGLLNAAYVRNPKYYDTLWFGVDAPANLIQGTRYNPACYSAQVVTWGAHRLVLLGGLGGKDPACKGPVP